VAASQDFDRAQIESQLVWLMQRRSVSYQVQDLVCTLCKQTKATNMADRCTCAGTFANTVPRSEFQLGWARFAPRPGAVRRR
jgi:DNA polymerase epsilon subunit 1